MRGRLEAPRTRQAGHGERHDVHAPVTGFHHRVFSNNGFVSCAVVQLIATDERRERVLCYNTNI
jgi:hypothetical protein